MDARHPEGGGILPFNMVWNQAIKFVLLSIFTLFFENVRLSNRLRVQKHHFRLPSFRSLEGVADIKDQ